MQHHDVNAEHEHEHEMRELSDDELDLVAGGIFLPKICQCPRHKPIVDEM